MNTPSSFVIVLSISLSIFILSIFQLFGLINFSPMVLFCFSVSSALLSINSFIDNYSTKSETAIKVISTIKIFLQCLAVIFMICVPYSVTIKDFSYLNNFVSLLSLSLIVLAIGLNDLKKYYLEKKINNMFKSNFMKKFKVESLEKIRTMKKANEFDSPEAK